MQTDKEKSCFGLVTIAGHKSVCYKIVKQGTNVDVQPVNEISVNLQKNQKKGGQSAPRIERLRQEKEAKYVKDIGKLIVKSYMRKNHTHCTIEGLVLAGPGKLKYKVSQTVEDYFNGKVIIDTDKIDPQAPDFKRLYLKEMVSSTERRQIELVEEIKDRMTKADDKLVYGRDEVLSQLEQCMLKEIIIGNKVYEEEKKQINNLVTYDCKISQVSQELIESIGVDIVGILFYTPLSIF